MCDSVNVSVMLRAMNGHDELSDRSLEKPVSSASIYIMLEVLQWQSSLVSCTRLDVRTLHRGLKVPVAQKA